MLPEVWVAYPNIFPSALPASQPRGMPSRGGHGACEIRSGARDYPGDSGLNTATKTAGGDHDAGNELENVSGADHLSFNSTSLSLLRPSASSAPQRSFRALPDLVCGWFSFSLRWKLRVSFSRWRPFPSSGAWPERFAAWQVLYQLRQEWQRCP